MAPYRAPSAWRSMFQLANTVLPLTVLWLVMLWAVDGRYWLSLLLAVPAALLLVRLFMFQHDCGHGAFFRSRTLNNLVGSVIGVLTLVPYAYWRKTHAVHHATSGNLEQRTFGDIITLTVREYLSLSTFKRVRYRLYRHPLVMLVIGPFYQFVLKHRFPYDLPRSWRREWTSVHRTNLALLLVVIAMWLTIGLDRFLLVQLPITLIAGSIGVFLFYVQHQYEDTYWRYRDAWNYYDAGLEGSSYFVLPAVLRWFTANIGFHHIHHVCSRIPNYRLQRCFEENLEVQRVTRLSIVESVRTLRMSLWDEEERKLVGFRDLPRIFRRLGHRPAATTKADAIPRGWR